jgi:hypothetical protein
MVYRPAPTESRLRPTEGRKHPLIPIYINNLEQIHRVAGSLIANHLAWAKMAIPTNHDLL